jgi:flagellar assembly protein FliH
MSTSSDFSWAGSDPAICSFEYPAPRFGAAGVRPEGEATQRQSETQKQLHQARLEGQREGELRARTIFEESLKIERENLQRALAAFDGERKSYFRRVETEVVQLALAIARKVIHREAQVDKSLLAGIVRVSIGQLADSTGMMLRVHPSQEQEWNSFFAANDLGPRPQITPDATVAADQCVISTQLGTTEIGIESQLKEIELGLFDLMAQRPSA